MEKVPPFPAGEHKSSIPLTSPIITHAVPQTFQSIDGANQPIANNGINADGGLSQVYQQSITDMVNGANPIFEYVTSNGNKLMLASSTSGRMNIWVQKADGSLSNQVGATYSVCTRRRILPYKYKDIAISSDNHLLGIYLSDGVIYLDEINISTLGIIRTTNLSGSGFSDLAFIKICKANTLTYSSIKATSGIVYCETHNLVFFVAATAYVIVNTVSQENYTADNLSAIYNAGTVVVASPYNTTISSPGLYYNSTPSDYSTWANITYTGGIQGIVIAPIGAYMPSTTNLIAQASTFSKTSPVFKLTISAIGAVSTATAFGSAYSSSGTSANFQMESGVVTPWGCSGIYSTSGIAPFGVFDNTIYKDNNPNTTKPLFSTDLSCSYASIVITVSSSPRLIGINSFLNKISSIGASSTNVSDTPAILNDIGGADNDSDIVGGNIYNSTRYNNCFIPPDYRSETTLNDVNGAGIIYRTNMGTFIYVQLADGMINPSYIAPQEIAQGVLRINNISGYNKIIDTNTFELYDDYSGYGLPILLNYTNTSSVAYIRAFNKYSTSLDYGQIKADASITNMVPLGFVNTLTLKQNNTQLWDGATGDYLGTIGTTSAGGLCYLYTDPSGGTYVNNPSVPPGNDAIYAGGAIIMPLSRALQTPNYCGFLLPNLLSSAQYTDFFILKGAFYTYDGNFIYELPLSSGVGSTLSGVPQPLLTCEGLKFLDCSQSYAYFLDNFDNSIWAYSGGREISKLAILSKKPDILSGKYNDYDNTLYLTTASSIISMRDESTITENALPYSSGTWNTYSTQLGVYYVQGATCILRTYKKVTSSTLIPLIYQTGYMGYQSGSGFTVNRIKMRIACMSGLTSSLNLTWNWVTQDNSGTDTATITTSMQSASGYFTFEWTPPHNNVILFSFGLTDASGIQKLVLLNLDVYTTYVAEASISNKVP